MDEWLVRAYVWSSKIYESSFLSAQECADCIVENIFAEGLGPTHIYVSHGNSAIFEWYFMDGVKFDSEGFYRRIIETYGATARFSQQTS